MSDATYRPDDWPPEPKPYRLTAATGANAGVVPEGRTVGFADMPETGDQALRRRVAELEKSVAFLLAAHDRLAVRLADHGEAIELLAENDEDVAANTVRNERLRKTIEDRADEAKSYAEAPEDGAERGNA